MLDSQAYRVFYDSVPNLSRPPIEGRDLTWLIYFTKINTNKQKEHTEPLPTMYSIIKWAPSFSSWEYISHKEDVLKGVGEFA